jgi:hypothetical protein
MFVLILPRILVLEGVNHLVWGGSNLRGDRRSFDSQFGDDLFDMLSNQVCVATQTRDISTCFRDRWFDRHPAGLLTTATVKAIVDKYTRTTTARCRIPQLLEDLPQLANDDVLVLYDIESCCLEFSC